MGLTVGEHVKVDTTESPDRRQFGFERSPHSPDGEHRSRRRLDAIRALKRYLAREVVGRIHC